MRPAVLEFARDVAGSFPIAGPLVEIGARAAAGQEDVADLRSVFGAAEHIGCDLQPGPGVDRIEDVHDLTFADESVGTVVCLETLEHVADPLRAVAEMHRVLRPGGVLAISSLMFFPIHDHPHDYWRFTPEGFGLLLEPFEASVVVAQGWELLPDGVFGVGVKGPCPGLDRTWLPRTANIADRWGEGKRVDLGPMRMSTRELWRFTLKSSVEAVRAPRPPVTIEEINAVTLVTADMAVAVGFYEALGFVVAFGGGPAAEFTTLRAGSGFVNLQLDRTWEPPARVWGRVILWVDDVDALYDLAVAAGHTPLMAPSDAPWGERYFHLRDPSGHELSFARRLP